MAARDAVHSGTLPEGCLSIFAEPATSFELPGQGPESLLALLYAAAGHLGLEFANYQANATLVWPPTGLSLAALILFGRRLWPGVFVGALLLNALDTQLGWLPSLGVATGNTLEETELNIREAIQGHIETLREFGEPVPKPTSQAKLVDASPAA